MKVLWRIMEDNGGYLGDKRDQNGTQHLPQEEAAACPHAKNI